MAQNRNGNRQRTARNTQAGRNAYVYDNTARKLNTERRQKPVHSVQANTVRKNREKAKHMSLGYVAFLVVAMAASAIILINYIQLQAELTNTTRTVAKKESILNNLKIANDENYNRIASSIDLEMIKSIAIGELGMTYAAEGQIVLYTNESNDYMRQISQNN